MMIGIDTNILLRLCDDDDKAQRDPARAPVRARSEGGWYVNEIVLVEFAWSLTRFYKLSRDEVARRLALVLDSPEFVIAGLAEARRAMDRFRTGPADFAHYFLAELNATAGCATTATFDRDALISGEPFSSVPI